MRRMAVMLFGLLTGLLHAQLRPTEISAIDDALLIGHLRKTDLGQPGAGLRPLHRDALADPLAGIATAIAAHRDATDSGKLLTLASRFQELPEAKLTATVLPVPTQVPEPLRRPIGRLVGALVAVNAEIKAATARLAPTERRALLEALPRLAAEDPSLLLDFAKGTPTDFVTVRDLLDRVDAARIEAAGLWLARIVQEEVPNLKRATPANFGGLSFKVQGLNVELGGTGNDRHVRRDVALCIDLGGDDRYAGRYAAGAEYASVLIDLSGNDRYYGADLNFGAGILGVGILVDAAGDDVYGVRSVGLGCGLAGFGMLADEAGDDRYRVVGLGLGAGARGLGILSDRLGDDDYEAGQCGESFASERGLGWLVDGTGRDQYRGGERTQAFARLGGVALLTDLGGNDDYRAQSGQAAAQGGYASLYDAEGDDQYSCISRGQSWAVSQGWTALIDEAGSDAYLIRRGAGQATAIEATAILLDREGDDLYGGAEPGLALSLDGVAIFLDAAGDDRYLASFPSLTPTQGIRLAIDTSGRDRYGDDRLDGQAVATVGSVLVDVYGGGKTATDEPSRPAVGSLPMPEPAAFRRLWQRALEGPDASGALDQLMGIGLPAARVLADTPAAKDVFVAVIVGLGTGANELVGELLASGDPKKVRLALASAGFATLPAERLNVLIAQPEYRLEVIEAMGKSGDRAFVSTLKAAAVSVNIAERKAAMHALLSLADASGAFVGAAELQAEDFALRRDAQKLLALDPSLALQTARPLLSDLNVDKRRTGIQLLGVVATNEAWKLLEPFFVTPERELRIAALMAVDGKVPTSLIPAVEALRRDADPLVRAVAARTNVGN